MMIETADIAACYEINNPNPQPHFLLEVGLGEERSFSSITHS